MGDRMSGSRDNMFFGSEVERVGCGILGGTCRACIFSCAVGWNICIVHSL